MNPVNLQATTISYMAIGYTTVYQVLTTTRGFSGGLTA